MTAGDPGSSLRVRPSLLRPVTLDRGLPEVALLGACALALVVAFVLQMAWASSTALAPVGVVPVLAASWWGSRRVVVAVLTVAVAMEVVLALHGDLQGVTAGTRSLVIVGLGVLARIAALGYAGTRAGAARLALVSRVARIATSSSSLQEILAQVLDEMDREGLRGGVILLIDEQRRLYIAAAQGDLDEAVRNSRLAMGEGIMGRVAQTGRSVLVPDIDAPDAPPAANRNLGSNAKMRSLVAVPLLSAGTVIGVLAVDSSRPHNFDDRDLATMEQIAVAIAGSVQRAGALQLADRLLQQRLNELALLLDTAARLSMSLELDVVLREVVRATAAVVSHGNAQLPPRASVFRVEQGWARPLAVEDDDAHAQLPADLPLDEHPFMRRVISDGGVVAARFEQTGPRVAESARRLGLVSGAWAPIWTGATLFGVLAASSRDDRDFDAEELRLLEGIARIAGLAVGNAESLRLERERSEEAREHAGRMAAVERVKSEFLRLASHELRGPLGVLAGYLSMMEDGSLPDEQLPRVVRVLGGKVAEMNRLVDQMLETARLEEGRLQLESGRVDVAALMSAAVRAVLPLGASRHDVVIQADDDVVVLGDSSRILTVLVNLVGNAVKYSPRGGRVLCRVWAAEGRALVRVSDQGIGIAAEDLPRLFTRFGRVVTPENSHIAGTGLGLYLARELARMHGGDITVSSVPGQGSTFELWLPLAGTPGAVHRLPPLVSELMQPGQQASDADEVRPAAQQ